MKQGKSNPPELDLEALEREIAAAAPAKVAVPVAPANDPLAELARIMGQESPFAGLDNIHPSDRPAAPSAMSLDDILNAPPSAALRPYVEQEPVSHAPLNQPVLKSPAIEAEAIEVAFDNSEELVAEKAEAPGVDEPEDDLFEGKSEKAAVIDEDDDLSQALERARLAAVEDDERQVEAAAVTVTQTKQPQFDDMLAEFESAMRDVGGEKITKTTMPSLAPSMVPPPPEEFLRPEVPEVRPTVTSEQSGNGFGSGLAGAAAAGAAAIAAGSLANAEPKTAGNGRRGLMLAGGVLGIAAIGIGALFAFGPSPNKNVGKDAPVIAAKTGVTKERPANPGGVDVPNQDKEVLKAPSATTTTAEKVVPREEQPVDLKQAQTAAAAATAVRQIPGVSGVPATPSPPATTPATSAAATPSIPAPASPSVAGSQPVPRPVASVPISIAGQPPAVAPPVAPAPVATPVVPPAPIAAAPVATPPAPAATAPAAAQPAAPRKVRTVPIREGEAAPALTASQPRVVPAAPRAEASAEPEGANAPMRITPQALRNTQRVASAAPAETAAPAAQPASRPAASSGGSGFSVQLGAEGNQDAARAKFNRVKDQHSDVLGSQNANIRNAEVNGRTVYRIRVGNMSRDEAVSMCERLKADGGNCFVAKN